MSTTHTPKQTRSLTTATITEVESLSPRLRRIRLSATSIRDAHWTPGQKVKIRAGHKLKSYTPARVDKTEGWMDLVFFLHGNGAASEWARSAKVGQRTEFTGPADSMPFITREPDWALFLGDETTIGLAAALIESLPDGVPVDGVIELDEEDRGALRTFGLGLGCVSRRSTHGTALLDWLADTQLPTGKGIVWLSGEAESVRAIKEVLLDRGLDRQTMKIKPYWSIRGHAHRKQLQKNL